MMENRSFDHYLGSLPGADGRQAGLTFTDNQGQARSTYWLRDNYQGCGFLDPDHSWQGGRTGLDGERMDGFLRAQSDVFSIGYYAEPRPPVHAARGQVVHRVRPLLLLAAGLDVPQPRVHARRPVLRDDGQLAAVLADRRARLPGSTIFHSLSQAGVSNRYFFTDIPVSAL